MLVINAQLRIPLREFQFSYARSSGPGGQNVNKVNTKATLRWPVVASPSLPEGVRRRLFARHGRRITSEGELVISSQRFREAGRNAADSLEKLRQLLAQVATPPKRRRATRPTRGSVERRLRGKQHQARKKGQRRTPDDA